MNFQPITIEIFLRELARYDRSESARKFRQKLNCDLPPSQCLMLHLIDEKQVVRPVDHLCAARMLVHHKGMCYNVQGSGKAANGKPVIVCRLTDKGEAAAKEIRAITQAIVDRINAKAREGVTAS